MLFFCRWVGGAAHVSLVIDAEDEETARENATTEADGAPPDTVTAIPPGVVVLEVYFDDDDGAPSDAEDAVLLVEPFDHTIDALAALENGDAVELSGAETAACGAEATDDDERVVSCGLADGHAGQHRAGELTW